MRDFIGVLLSPSKFTRIGLDITIRQRPTLFSLTSSDIKPCNSQLNKCKKYENYQKLKNAPRWRSLTSRIRLFKHRLWFSILNVFLNKTKWFLISFFFVRQKWPSELTEVNPNQGHRRCFLPSHGVRGNCFAPAKQHLLWEWRGFCKWKAAYWLALVYCLVVMNYQQDNVSGNYIMLQRTHLS